MKEDCLFCKIASGEMEADIVYEDAEIVGFKDINGQAPVHFLFIPRKHIETLNDISEEDNDLVGRIFNRIKEVASKNGIAEDGYRVVTNCNKGAGQAVFHIHFHLLGGRTFLWPPG